MKSQIVLAIGAAVTAGVLSQVQPEAVADATVDRDSVKQTARIAPRGDNQARNAGSTGADVIVGELPGVAHWTSSGAINGMRAYSVATTSCNIGDEILRWEPNNTYHPVIGQNMFRVADGRIEQIGQSWLKHGFCALQLTACGPCQSAGGGCPPMLGIGCSDPYGEFLNGDQPGLGPRFEVNPSTGIFQYPFSNPNGASGDSIFKRIQVNQADLLTSNATYFVEGQYIHRDDAAAGNGNNNASYRRVSINGNFSIDVEGSTQRELPAIYAWGAHGNGTNQPDNDVVYEIIDVPGDGRFILAYKVSENTDGSYHYEYAVQNLNSDRAGGSFAVPVGSGATVFNVGFNDVKYHSGEPFDSSPWSASNGSGEVRWSSPKSFVQDPNSNALRWGTMYNYRFDSDAPPVAASLELGLFKGGSPASMSVDILAPGDVDPEPGCAADIAQNDGVVDTFDLLFLLEEWGTIGASDADIAGDGTSEPDGVVDTFDLLLLLESWGDC